MAPRGRFSEGEQCLLGQPETLNAWTCLTAELIGSKLRLKPYHPLELKLNCPQLMTEAPCRGGHSNLPASASWTLSAFPLPHSSIEGRESHSNKLFGDRQVTRGDSVPSSSWASALCESSSTIRCSNETASTAGPLPRESLALLQVLLLADHGTALILRWRVRFARNGRILIGVQGSD